jgi:hypothetical protein
MVEAADVAERLDELVVCSGFDASDMGLEFGECHFDRFQGKRRRRTIDFSLAVSGSGLAVQTSVTGPS